MLSRITDPSDKFLLNPANQGLIETKLELMLKSLSLRSYILMPVVIVVLIVAMALTLAETMSMTRVFYQGTEVTAQDFDIRYETTNSIRLNYRFAVDGKTLQRSQNITNEIAVKLEFEPEIKVWYLPEDPAQNYYIDSPDVIYWRAGGSVLCLLLIPVLSIITLRYFIRYAQLWRQGRRTPGKISVGKIERIEGNYDRDNFVVTVHYTVRPFLRKFSGQTSITRNDLKHAILPPPKTKVYVLLRSGKHHQAL